MASCVSSIGLVTDKLSFVALCRELLEANPHVRYFPDRLPMFSPAVVDATAVGWEWLLRDPAAPLQVRWAEFALNAGLNGGYFFADPSDGTVKQWAHDGSGSKMLTVWLASLAERGLTPLLDCVTPNAGWRHAVDELLEGVPYAPERRAILEEFADPCASAKLSLITLGLTKDEGILRGRLTFKDVRILAKTFPASFGGDPFAKKACLAILFLVGHLVASGHDVQADIPIPADYQLPRIFEWGGALSVSPSLNAILRQGDLLDPLSDEVMALRAGAVVASSDLALMMGQPDWVIDGALFTRVRKDPRFQAESLPPMRISGIWF